MNTHNVIFPTMIVEYTYTHHLNRRSSTQITKRGIVVRAIRDKKGLQRPTGYYLVKLNGNKNPSRIHESKIVSLHSTDVKLLTKKQNP